MQVMKMVVSSGLPFRFVNNSYFRRFVKEVQRYKAEYTPPSDFPLRTTLLDKTYEQVAADLQVLLPLSIFIIFPFLTCTYIIIGELPVTSATVADPLQPDSRWVDRYPG